MPAITAHFVGGPWHDQQHRVSARSSSGVIVYLAGDAGGLEDAQLYLPDDGAYWPDQVAYVWPDVVRYGLQILPDPDRPNRVLNAEDEARLRFASRLQQLTAERPPLSPVVQEARPDEVYGIRFRAYWLTHHVKGD